MNNMENKILNTSTEKEPVKVEEVETPKMETANVEELKAKEETVKAENLTAARESMKEEKAEKEDAFKAYALGKLDEMKAAVEEKKKGWLNRLLVNEETLNLKISSINNQIAEVNKGKMVDLVSIKRNAQYADKVDVSDAPERANKDYSYGGVKGHDFGSGK
jgi:hypothetical protein